MTHFATQSCRFADLYSSACVNLLSYPDCHLFTAPHQLVRNLAFTTHTLLTTWAFFQMPHESYIEQTTERDVPSPLSPVLHAKLDAKHVAQKKMQRVGEGLSTWLFPLQ